MLCGRCCVTEARSRPALQLDIFIEILLGSSLSSDAARSFLQICHKALEDGIGDAPLEAPQRYLTRFVLRHLLVVSRLYPLVYVGMAAMLRTAAWNTVALRRAAT
jgi:hypothetical protein